MRQRQIAAILLFFLMMALVFAPLSFRLGQLHSAQAADRIVMEPFQTGTPAGGAFEVDCVSHGPPATFARSFVQIDCRDSISTSPPSIVDSRQENGPEKINLYKRPRPLAEATARSIAADGLVENSAPNNPSNDTADAAREAPPALSFYAGGGRGSLFGGAPSILPPAFVSPSDGEESGREDDGPAAGGPENNLPDTNQPPAPVMTTPIPAALFIWISGLIGVLLASRRRTA